MRQLLNNLRIRILGNWEMFEQSQFVGRYSLAQCPVSLPEIALV